jgi:eukaryotic-like serine/threonine-protein kinase
MPLSERLTQSLSDRYRIDREIGAGGMATVYLAHDLRHDRPVALKIMRPELAAVIGAERFLAEIRTTANLQHPHILPLHDSGAVEGTVFYVMPLVRGESLRERLDREQQLPVADAVRIVSEVASALDYAHRQGVIHRDIKPENILLHDGSALIADFGIALAASQTDGSARLTETGMSLGTPTYMSPEQAMGERTLDARTDVYALGCVLYEALVGEPPFTGPTAQSIVARVMTEAPRDLTAQRSTVPRNVNAATAVALAKLPADRFSSAAAFTAALANPSFGLVENANAATTPSLWTPRRIALIAGGAAVALVAGVLLGAGTATAPANPSGIVVESAILPPAGEHLSDRRSFALSPDGQRLAFVALSERGEQHLWIRDLASLHAVRIEGTRGANAPFWSPDGRAIAFFASDQLRRLDFESGTMSTLCPAREAKSGTWGAGNLIVITTDRGIERLRADRAECEVAIAAEDGYRFLSPSLVDDGPKVLFDRGRFIEADSGSWDTRFSVVIGDLDAGTFVQLIAGAWTPTFVAPDLVLFARITPSGNPVFAQSINRDRTRLEGDPVTLTETVRSTDLQFSYSASAGGTLTYLPSRGDPEKLLVDRRGVVLDTVRQRNAYTHTVANTRRLVALSTGLGLWVYDLDRNTSTPLLTEGGRFSFDPVWSPDDASLAFGLCSIGRLDSLPAGIHVLPLERCRRATDWSADGRYLIVEVGLRHSTRAGIVAWDIEHQQREDLFEFTGVHSEATVSPDGRWIAYVSAETGTSEVYVRPFRASGRTVRLTSGGARSPRWRADGREFFYQTADGRIMSVPLPPGADIASAVATTLFRAPEYARPMFFDRGTTFDVTADGQQFVVRMTASDNHAVLLQNWRAKLGAR